MSVEKRLYRSRSHRMIAGVVGGIAERIGVDATLLRIWWVIASLLIPPMLVVDLLIYIALVIIIPLMIGGVNWYRGYRADRALLRS